MSRFTFGAHHSVTTGYLLKVGPLVTLTIPMLFAKVNPGIAGSWTSDQASAINAEGGLIPGEKGHIGPYSPNLRKFKKIFRRLGVLSALAAAKYFALMGSH